MTPERWRLITSIFQTARARDAAEREALLAAACAGDAALRGEVDALLAADEHAGPFGENPIAFTEWLRLEPGESIGPYRIAELIGAGGMGEVYRAHDARLERDVAIKIVPLAALDDADSRRRLVREARAAAALNHPHICTIHEVGEHDGQTYIVMELVEGRPLDELIPAGGLPVDEVVRYGLQISDAVGHAHQKGVVHRDLKTSNIMVTREGRVKVLDFGLARRVQGVVADATSAQSRSSLARDGLLAGTLPYMSPEQLRGQPADARSDVWALGIVLYEMTAGARPFTGRTDFELTSAILNDQLPTAADYSELRGVTGRCLEKDPERRFQSAAEVREAISVAAHPGVSPRWRHWRLRSPHALAATALLAVTLALVFSVPKLLSLRPGIGPAPATNERMVQEPVVRSQSAEWNSRISPDREWISYISDSDGGQRIWLQRVEGGDPKPLSTAAGRLSGHVWSPDGREIAYVVDRPRGKSLQIVPALFGGSPRLSIEINHPFNVRPIAWIRDDIYLAVPPWLLRVDLHTHAIEDLSARWTVKPSSIAIRPDGRKIAFSATVQGQSDVWISNPDGTQPSRLTNDRFVEGDVIWSGADAVVYASNRGGQVDLWRMSVTDRAVRQLTTSAAEDVPEAATTDESMLTYEEVTEAADLWQIDPGSHSERPLTKDGHLYFWPATATAGSTIAFQRVKPVHDSEVFAGLDTEVLVTSQEALRSPSSPLRLADGFAPLLSNDGKWIAFLQWAKTNRAETHLMATDLATNDAHLVSDHFQIPGYTNQPPFDALGPSVAWARARPDLYFVEQATSGLPEVRRFHPAKNPSAPDVVFTAKRGDRVRDLVLSHDDQRLAYLRWANNATEIRIRRLSDGSETTVFSEASSVMTFHLTGWLKDDRRLQLLRSSFNPDQTFTVDVLLISPDSASALLRTLPRAFPAGARLDTASGTLYITTVEAGVHNLSAYSLADRRLRTITSDVFPGVTFSGAALSPDGTLICSRQQVGQDIWMLRRDR